MVSEYYYLVQCCAPTRCLCPRTQQGSSITVASVGNCGTRREPIAPFQNGHGNFSGAPII